MISDPCELEDPFADCRVGERAVLADHRESHASVAGIDARAGTIMSGKSISGSFHSLPEGRVVLAGGRIFRVSYKDSRITSTAMRAVPPTEVPVSLD